MKSYAFAFITVFLIFVVGITILGSMVAMGAEAQGTVTLRYILKNILPPAALLGLIAGVVGSVLLVKMTEKNGG